ncbi:hypothetical protein GmHk_06G016448 [Glycine max]|nr:hypothetical protein GmHk_06G016448 [Glycine max]
MITLDDVSSILHLPITGALHSFHALSTEEARFLLTELLEVSAEEVVSETRLTRGAYVRLGWVRDIYETRCRPWHGLSQSRLSRASCCCTLLLIRVQHTCMWSTLTLSDLAHSGGYAWLLALRSIYEHFPSVHQYAMTLYIPETPPRASWLTRRRI